jgi:hypothetical protein
MLGIDRLSGDRPADQRDIPGDIPAPARDRPEPANPAADEAATDQAPRWGALLSDARTRQEYALAYRAKVDAIYAAAEQNASRGTADRFEDRPSVADKYPADYVPATHAPPHVDGPHEPPEKWARDINIDAGLPGRRNNCGECSRAVSSTWYGVPKAAAAMADARSGGEPAHRMAEWTGQRSVPASMGDIGQRLTELGPGSSAIVGCDWKEGKGGHWFNAVNDGGALKTVDGQRNRVGSWPPVFREVRFDESLMRLSDAVFFDPDGKVVRIDHP